MASRKVNFVIRLQHWMDSVPGQTFLNYAYSWGAAIVILGTLFKLTYLPGANLMLFLGMGTEVVVFFLSAFDRPFDKSEEGRELPKFYETDEEILARMNATDTANADADSEPAATAEQSVQTTTAQAAAISAPAAQPTASTTAASASASTPAGPTIIIGGVTHDSSAAPVSTAASLSGTVADEVAAAHAGKTNIDAQKLADIIRLANDELLRRAQAVLSPEMEEATRTYIEKLQSLNDTLTQVDEQNRALTRDSHEMENLGRALTGISTVYELQLKGVSAQVSNIDRINEQTRRMAEQIEELNGVYARMIQALTVNMRAAAPGAPVGSTTPSPTDNTISQG